MNLQDQLNKTSGFGNLDLLARQVVEGYISGLHKSPFHGFSAEFAEHKLYNPGESTKHIDWKLYAKTDRLYTKKYEEETNLRCHFILDNSSSMCYPFQKTFEIDNLNKISFSAMAIAAIMNIMKKQRDSVGLSIYGSEYEFYTSEKGSDRHHNLLLSQLENCIVNSQNKADTKKGTATYQHLHLIAEKLKRRSLVFIFSDMFQSDIDEKKLFSALQHLKHNKHDVVLFHTFSQTKELDFDFSNTPKRFEDVETGEYINLYADMTRESYQKATADFFNTIKLKCAKYNIKYVPAPIEMGFNSILTNFLVERQKFI